MDHDDQASTVAHPRPQDLSRNANDASPVELQRFDLPPAANTWCRLLRNRPMAHKLIALRAFTDRTKSVIERFSTAIANMEIVEAYGYRVHVRSEDFPAEHYESVKSIDHFIRNQV
jgi:hypothetical protein